MRRTPALIVGGGPAGAAAAIGLARAGLRPLLLERDRETGDALCGGFLSWRTLAALERLGVDAAALGGRPAETLRLFAGTRTAEARLPAAGIGLSRRALDTALLARAAAEGATVDRGVRVRSASGTAIVTADGAEIEPASLLLATGKHELRGLARPREAAGADPALGLRRRLRPSAALARTLAGAIELHLFRGGYAGLLLQEGGSANLCLAVRRSRLEEAGGDPAALIAQLGTENPRLGDRLAAAEEAGAVDAVAHVPYGWRARETAPGLFRLGDQAGVIPSLAGEGIAIALASGIAAARAVAAGRSAPDFQRSLAARLRRPIATAALLRDIAERPAGAAALARAVAMAPALARLAARLTRVGG